MSPIGIEGPEWIPDALNYTRFHSAENETFIGIQSWTFGITNIDHGKAPYYVTAGYHVSSLYVRLTVVACRTFKCVDIQLLLVLASTANFCRQLGSLIGTSRTDCGTEVRSVTRPQVNSRESKFSVYVLYDTMPRRTSSEYLSNRRLSLFTRRVSAWTLFTCVTEYSNRSDVRKTAVRFQREKPTTRGHSFRICV